MGSDVDKGEFAGAREAGLYNSPRPSTAAALCMVKEVFHVNHFARRGTGGGFQFINKVLTYPAPT